MSDRAAAALSSAQHRDASSSLQVAASDASLTQPTVVLAPRSSELLAFQQSARTRELYNDAFTSYLALTSALHVARTSLDAFKQKCTSSSPKISLPLSISKKLAFVQHCRLPTADLPATFFTAEIDQLNALEVETTKRIFAILLRAKEKHLEQLATQANIPTFILHQKSEFSKHVHRTFDFLDAAHGRVAATAAAPAAASSLTSSIRAHAIAEFEHHLSSKINEHLIVRSDEMH